MARSTAYDKYPEHTLEFESKPASIRVSVGDVVVAETQRGLTLVEARYAPTVYVPRDDVDFAKLTRVEQTTHCPFKGDANYYDFGGEGDGVGDGEQENPIAWTYEDPFDQVNELRDCLAFYADRTTIEALTD